MYLHDLLWFEQHFVNSGTLEIAHTLILYIYIMLAFLESSNTPNHQQFCEIIAIGPVLKKIANTQETHILLIQMINTYVAIKV